MPLYSGVVSDTLNSSTLLPSPATTSPWSELRSRLESFSYWVTGYSMGITGLVRGCSGRRGVLGGGSGLARVLRIFGRR